MLVRLLYSLVRTLRRIAIVGLVLLASYVSLGRQFMPAVSDYTEFFESQLLTRAGLTVKIASLTGSFQGFNPTLEISGLNLLLETAAGSESEADGLVFESATITLDVPASLWQQRWVFQEFEVAGLSIALEQQESGRWLLRGMQDSAPRRVELEAIYSAFLGLEYVKLSQVDIALEPTFGEPLTVDVSDARIQNRNGEHLLLVDAQLPGIEQSLQFTYEGTGESLSSAAGFAYANVPAGEYLTSLGSLLPAEFLTAASDVVTLRSGGEVWLELEAGELVEATVTLALDTLELRQAGTQRRSTTRLDDFRAVATLRRSRVNALAGGSRPQLEFVVQATQGSWDGERWEPFSAGFVLRQNEALELRADSLDLGRILGLARQLAEVGYLPISENALDSLTTLAPRGRLRNLSLRLEGRDGFVSPVDALNAPLESLSLRANADAVSIQSLGSVPMLDGVTGYLEAEYQGATATARGFAEVETNALRMLLPSVYTREWDYSYVNGRIDFLARLQEGFSLKLKSNAISAVSENTDATVQFFTQLERPLEGEPESVLELLIGVNSMDAADRYLYLPDGPRISPSLQATMEWVGGAVREGTFTNSGAIFRGSTVRGSRPEEKTFQSFYRLSEGRLRYAQGWAEVDDAQAFVETADSLIDVELFAGVSDGLVLSGAKGTVRPVLTPAGERRNQLIVTGSASGATDDALHFLADSPLPTGLTSTLSSWQAKGDMDVELEVDLLLGGEMSVDVRAEMAMQANRIDFSDYDLVVEDLGGEIVFDTREGLNSRDLRGQLFSYPVTLALGSEADEAGEIAKISASAKGSATAESIAALASTGLAVDSMLAQSEGVFDFEAMLQVEQNSDSIFPTTLRIESGLQGLEIAAPAPFGKSANEARQLDVLVGFGGEKQNYRGQFGEGIEFDLSFAEAQLEQGLVYLGESPTALDSLTQTPYAGLVVLGDMAALDFQQWSDFVAALALSANEIAGTANAGGAAAVAEELGFVDIKLGKLSLFDQGFADLSLRLRADLEAEHWLVDLAGPELEGHVEAPFGEGALLVALQRLRLAGDEDSLMGPKQLVEINEDSEEIDSLATLDPRAFPEMRFSTRSLMIGDRPYGSWRFHLQPDAEGALFGDLAFDFRGLKLAPQFLEPELIGDWSGANQATLTALPNVPRSFYWRYDGLNHHSEFEGVLEIGDLGEVLSGNGYAPSLVSRQGEFNTKLSWPGTPAFFSAETLSGKAQFTIDEGRFLQGAGGAGALKLISILNFDAIMRRLRFSDDLLRSGLAFDQISGDLLLEAGQVAIQDQLVISGPSSLYQITGDVNLVDETILGEMYVTLPVSNNIPWLGLLSANLPIAVGAYLFDQIFGDQVDSLTSAVYTLDGPWEGLEPEFKQAFGSPESRPNVVPAAPQ